jgi:thiopeptide-type bacteriocin biosynthesis protein
VEQWRDWLDRVWSLEPVAEAVALASPVLARQVRKAREGRHRNLAEMRRVVMSLVRYVLRMKGRATPFGLFAGVTAAGLGPGLTARWGEEHRPIARPDAEWLAAVVNSLEGCPELLRRLPVVVNNLCRVRGNRLIVPHQQQDPDRSNRSDEPALVDVSVRYTRAVEAAMRYAHSPIVVSDLAGKLASEYPQTPPAVIYRMLAELVRVQALLTGLRSPMTVTDALSHVVEQLDAVDGGALPQVADRLCALRAIRDDITCHNRARMPSVRRERRIRLAEQMPRVGVPPERSISIDMRLDAHFVVPEAVAGEAAAAAAALTRLTPHPRGLPAWESYHGAFLERYGVGAVVPLLEVVDPAVGLGFPATYRGSARKIPAPPLSARDRRLIALVQKTAMGGGAEIALNDRMVSDLAGEDSEIGQVPPHVELVVQIHAASTSALERGEFELVVAGAFRAAGSTTGRFLDLLDPADQERFRGVYADVPTLRAEAMPVQVSCPPVQARSEGVARAPLMLPKVVSVAEHREPASAAIPLEELAVSGDTDGLFLVAGIESGSRRLVEPTVLNSVEFRYFSHPVVRFLCEVTRARAAVYMPFSWGAASSLPFLPRLRYGRTVLAPARWNLAFTDLPGRSAPWREWKDSLASWRRQFGLPPAVSLVEADNLLRLDLDEDMHLVLLRSHLDRRARATLDEAPHPDAYGWLGGRAHEVVLPLAATIPAIPPPSLGPATWIRPIGRDHGHLPGASKWLYAKLYGHPGQYTDVLTELPALLSAWNDPPEWWYLPYRDPDPHLRLRIRLPSADAYGPAAGRVGAWAGELRSRGLLGRVQLDTYYPETGRYGFGAAMTAAEHVFAADSTAALAQTHLAANAGIPAHAITAAGLVDLTMSFTGNAADGIRWLIDQLPHEPARVARPMYDAATRLADPRGSWAALRAIPGAESVLRAWCGRRAALTAYRDQLAAQQDPLRVLPSLLHLHHIRMLGIDPEQERASRRLARAAALRWAMNPARREP